jgi:hypothetical protein
MMQENQVFLPGDKAEKTLAVENQVKLFKMFDKLHILW